jgi:hypothetical protein
MKKQNVFTGMLLIGLGLFFVLRDFPFMTSAIFRWPTYILIIGIALFGQASKSKDSGLLFPASVISLLGVHYHGIFLVEAWPTHWSMFPLIVAIAFFVLFQKTRTGFFSGLLFFLVAAIGFLYHNGTGTSDTFLYLLNRYWAVLFLVVGTISLIRNKAY